MEKFLLNPWNFPLFESMENLGKFLPLESMENLAAEFSTARLHSDYVFIYSMNITQNVIISHYHYVITYVEILGIGRFGSHHKGVIYRANFVVISFWSWLGDFLQWLRHPQPAQHVDHQRVKKKSYLY